MKKRYIGILGLLGLLLLNYKFNNNQPKHVEYSENEVWETPKKKVRIPASVKQNPTAATELFKPEVSRSIREHHNNFIPPKVEAGFIDEDLSDAPRSASLYVPGDDGYGQGQVHGEAGPGEYQNSSDQTNANNDTISSSPDPSSGLYNTTSPWPSYSSDGSSSSSSDVLSCSSSLGGGAYGSPIEIGLTCSAPSEIRYCVSMGTCCDPLSSGELYSSKIVLGEQDGDYCVSFYGRDASDSESKVVQKNYNIDLTFPSLDVTHPKRYYQTTELSGVSHLASDMFGRLNFGIGVINLKSNDPGPSGFNLGCEEIVNNYMSLPAPAPKEVLSFFNTVSVAPTDQLNVPLRLDQLSYGDNFITSYMADNNFAVPLYSCSTTRVRLEDFDYFQADASHAVAGTNAVREFSGGFTGYGFFEEEEDVYRGPAGEGIASTGNEILESGIHSIFY